MRGLTENEHLVLSTSGLGDELQELPDHLVAAAESLVACGRAQWIDCPRDAEALELVPTELGELARRVCTVQRGSQAPCT